MLCGLVRGARRQYATIQTMQTAYHQQGNRDRETWLLSLCVWLIAFGTHIGTLAHGFVSDDFIFLRDLRFKNQDFTDSLGYFGSDWGMGADFYRPLTRLYWALLHGIFGETQWAWHLAGTLIFSASAALVFLLALRLSGHTASAIIAGLIFALHPAHAETVSWVANSSDLLAGLFCLLATLCYVSARNRWDTVQDQERYNWRRNALLALSAISFFAALLSKESAAGFILVPLILDLLFGAFTGRRRAANSGASEWLHAAREHLLRYAPFVLVAALYVWLRVSALGGIGGYEASPDGAPSLPLLVETYARWLLMPLVLNGTLLWLVFLAVVVGLAALLVRSEGGGGRASGQMPGATTAQGWSFPLSRTALFGLLWLVLFLLPTVTTAPSIRFVYLSTMGLALTSASLLTPLQLLRTGKVGRWKLDPGLLEKVGQAVSWVKLGLAGLLLIFAAGATWTHLDAWRRAGETAQAILAQIRDGRPDPRDYTPIYAKGLPEANEEALIFRTGFPEAVQLLYGNTTVEGIPVVDFPVVEQRLNEAYFVEYRDGRIAARDDVVAFLQGRNREIKARSEKPFLTWDFRGADLSSNPWVKVAGEGTLAVQQGALRVRMPGGGIVRPPEFTLPASALSWLELDLSGVGESRESAQLVVHWLVATANGAIERASAPLPIALDGQVQTYRVKPLDMTPFLVSDTVTAIWLELPSGVTQLSLERAQLYRLPVGPVAP